MRLSTAKPVLFFSNLTEDAIPVNADLTLRFSGAKQLAVGSKRRRPLGTAGSILIRTFRFRVFRREATLDHLALTPTPEGSLGVDGLVLYRSPEALIRIRLIGTTSKTRVVFDSEPAMDQQEILSLLLYGKPPSGLDADEASTVVNTQSAVSNKAFGLASLYLFASTPIEYVGYDPASRTYSMRVRLPGGETLALNSDFDQTKQIQLRKRLGPHFAVQAEATSTQESRNDVATFLEWFHRY